MKKMKNAAVLLMAGLMAFSCAACGGSDASKETTKSSEST